MLKRLAVILFKNIKIFAKFAVAKMSKWKRNIGGVCVFTVYKQHLSADPSFLFLKWVVPACALRDGMFANYQERKTN